MMPYVRSACLALAVVATAAPASAQTWVYEPDSPGQIYQPRSYVAPTYAPTYAPPAYSAPAYDNRAYDNRAYDNRAYVPPAYVPDTRVVVDEQPLALTPAQRTTIYRTIIPQGRGRGPIVKERIVTETVAPAPVARERVVVPRVGVDYADYTVGSRVADSYALAPLPPSVVTSVPAVRSYRYMVINNRLLLVDPATGIVVADVTQ
jgi:hypothetical protein